MHISTDLSNGNKEYLGVYNGQKVKAKDLFAVFRWGAAVRIRHDTRHLPNAKGLEWRVLQTTGQHCRTLCHHAGQSTRHNKASAVTWSTSQHAGPEVWRSCDVTIPVGGVELDWRCSS